jgi:hypothetical protein
MAGGATNTQASSTSTASTVSGTGTGWFMYGLVPGDVETTADIRGLGDPSGPVTVVRHGEVGALISEVPIDAPLGLPDHLIAYRELLDSVAVAVPVLPVRFGTVLESREAVAELLGVQHDGYLAALGELEGRVEYVVRARYVERTLLTEVLTEHPEAAALRDQLRGQPEDATRDLRIQLGEMINQAVEARRAADTQRLTDFLAPLSVGIAPQPPGHEQDAANAAFLIERDRRAEFEEAVGQLADEWQERATVRLLGPLAAYDFAAGL